MAVNKQLTRDLSPGAIKKAVISTSIQKPLTVYPATVGMLGAFYSAMFGMNIVALVAIVAGAGFTFFNWVYEYFIKGDQHANQFVSMYHKELEKRRIEALHHLEHELREIDNDQAVIQVELFRSKYDNFRSILERKLDNSELTYNRYLTIAEQVFLNGLDNLENAAIALKSISTIDVGRIAHDMDRLRNSAANDAVMRMTELNARLELRKEQLERVNSLLLTNEKALTQLDQVAARLANIDTRQSHAHVDMEDAMKELRYLIERAEKYSD